MSNRTNYNSIVFLTVYLGLVLVGASPQILAQAATTSRFEIKTEVVIEDDLDKKPDDDSAISDYSFAVEDLYELAKDFAGHNQDKLRGKHYGFDCSVIAGANFGYTVKCQNGSGLFSSKFIPSLKKIETVFPRITAENVESIRVNLILSDTDFSIKTSSPQNSLEAAELFSRKLNNSLSQIEIRRLAETRAVIFQNTEISFENNQVFIVTQLPRAAIDEPLAEKNAQ